MHTLFLDEPSIGTAEFINEPSKTPVFIDSPSFIYKTRTDLEGHIDLKFSEITQPLLVKVSEILKKNDDILKKEYILDELNKRITPEGFLEIFKQLPPETIEMLRGEPGRDGVDGRDGFILEVPSEQKIDVDQISRKILEEVSKTISSSEKNNEKLTPEQFEELFKSLPDEVLKKIRGPRGPKGQPGDGGAGSRGEMGPPGPEGPPGPSSTDYNGVIVYNEVSGVEDGGPFLVFSYHNTTGDSIFIDAVGGSSDIDGEWSLFINDIVGAKRITTAADLNLDIPLSNMVLSNGSTLKIKFEHCSTTHTANVSSEMIYHVAI